MEQLTTAEFFGLVIIGGLFLSSLIYWRNHEKGILHGFNDDFRNYLRSIQSTSDLTMLLGFEQSIKRFRTEYRKHIQKEVIDDACARLQAEIKNRRQVIEVLEKVSRQLNYQANQKPI